MAIRSTLEPGSAARRGVDWYYQFVEISILVIFLVSCALRGATTIQANLVQSMLVCAAAAASQALRIRVSTLDERISFGTAGVVLGLALPSPDVLTTLVVWAAGVTAGAVVVHRDLVAGAREGGRTVVLGVIYSTILGGGAVLQAPLMLSIPLAMTCYLAVSLLLWRLPGILADDGIVTRHLLVRRLALLFGVNAGIPMLAHYAEQQTYLFILSDPRLVKLFVDLTVTTGFFTVVALVLHVRDARRRLDGVIATATALPWPDDPDPLRQMTDFAAATLRVAQVEVRTAPPRSRLELGARFRTDAGDERHLIARRSPGSPPLLDRDQRALDAIAHIGEETMRVRGEATELRTRAHLDPLTGLLNYRGFQAAIEGLGLRRREPGGVAVVYLDVDDFKAVNDRYGHEVGNQVLRVVAERLQQAVRSRDTVARVGGDEFVVLLRDVMRSTDAEQAARRIVAAAGGPVAVGSHRLGVSLSEGVAFSPDQSVEPGALVNEADALMYARRGRWLAAGEDGAAGELRLTGGRAAIAELISTRQLKVAYQPIIDATKGTVTAVEALVRGTHPLYGVVEPSLLLYEARRLGLLDVLADQVLERAFTDVARIQQVAPGLRDLHVNLELSQLRSGQLPDRMLGLCAAHPDVRLTVELDKNSLHSVGEETLGTLGALRSAGIRLALDDFGQGHSTMLAMVDVPFDALKVDRSLIAGIATSGKSVQVVRSLVRLCRSLHVTMIVEGVETAEQRDVLVRLGARHMQGFLFSRPESAETLCDRFAARGVTVG
jgi:diguanylate cyclase (GGDEF)-like protein